MVDVFQGVFRHGVPSSLPGKKKFAFAAAQPVCSADKWVLQFFRETQEMLLSPLPEAKKISKPYARKCPWREGSLLAYQILSPKIFR